MKKQGNKGKSDFASKSNTKGVTDEPKKKTKLKPIKSKELKRTKNPAIFEDDEDFLEDDPIALDDFGGIEIDIDDED
jgi:hypothetical protein